MRVRECRADATMIAMRIRRLLRAVPVVTVLIATFVGCRSGALSGANARPTGFVAELTHMSSDDARFLFVEERLRRCMAEAGMDYAPQSAPPEEQDSRQRRARIGFGVSVDDVGTGPVAPTQLRTGRRTDGPESEERWQSEFAHCYAAGLQAAADKLEQALASLPGPLADEIRSVATLSHPVVKHGIALWSSCLKARGWAFDGPADMVTYLEEAWRRPQVSGSPDELARVQAYERAIAVAAWDCEVRTGSRAAVGRLITELQARATAAGAPTSVYM